MVGGGNRSMSAIMEQAERLIASMSAAEKAQVAETLSREVNGRFPGIEATPGVCGGDPRIAGHRIPVWVIWGYYKLGLTDAQLLANWPSITAQELVNALA